jgi:hypothetical protein
LEVQKQEADAKAVALQKAKDLHKKKKHDEKVKKQQHRHHLRQLEG